MASLNAPALPRRATIKSLNWNTPVVGAAKQLHWTAERYGPLGCLIRDRDRNFCGIFMKSVVAGLVRDVEDKSPNNQL